MPNTPEIPLDAFTTFADGLDHPECCAFDAQGNLWAGGEAGQIYRIDSSGHVEEVARTGGFSGGLAFSADGSLFVCNPAHGLLRLEPSGKWDVFAQDAAGTRLLEANYPLFDVGGNLYVSDSGGWKAGRGRVVRFDASGASTEIASGLGYANGLALTADGTALFVAESDSNSVYRIPLTIDGAPELFADCVGQVPDGLGLDVEGNLYVTCYGSHQILRVTPARQVSVFAQDPTGITLGGPTNLTFGGPDAREMYVANLGRRTILRAQVPRSGLTAANRRL
jgi:gluconolactonase